MPETRAAIVPLTETTLPSGRDVRVRMHAEIDPPVEGEHQMARALRVEVLLEGGGLPTEQFTLAPADAFDVLDAIAQGLLGSPLPFTGGPRDRAGVGSASLLPTEPIERQALAGDLRWASSAATELGFGPGRISRLQRAAERVGRPS